MTLALFLAIVSSGGMALLVTWVALTNATRLGLLDVPNERSSHTSVTPRGGGFGIVAGVAAGVLVLAMLGMAFSPQVEVVLSGSLGIAVLGAVDDLHRLRAGYRLVVQVLISAAVVAGLGGFSRAPLPPPLDISVGWLGAPLAVVWLVSVTNFYNFMDGIDGLAGGQAVASCVGVAIAAWSIGAVQSSLILAASAIGFLVFNRPPARIFLGDVGSTALGFTIAALPFLAAPAHRPAAVFAVAVGLSLFLLDPAETLLRLARQGHQIGQAHRVHSYQLLASNPSRRASVSAALVAIGTMLAIGGGVAYRVPWAVWPVAALGLCAFAVERYLAGLASSRGTRGEVPIS